MTVTLRRVPFRVRLALSFAVVMVILFGALALLLHEVFGASLDQNIDRSLRTRASDLAILVSGRSQLPQLPETGGAFAEIVDPSTGHVRDVTPGVTAPPLKLAQIRQAAQGSLLVDVGGRARVLARPVDTRPAAVLIVGASLAERNGALTTLSDLLFIGGPVLLILTCVSGYVLAARALAPVEKMRAQAARISGAPHGERLPLPEANDELHRLGDTVNAMLSRLEDTLARERALVADAGHELRTPLAILKLELELALGEGGSDGELHARVRSAAEEVDRLSKLADDLLVIARAEQGRLPLERQRLEVGEVLDSVASRFASAAGSHGRAVRWEGSSRLRVEADRARLEQALTNMVSNALRYGSGPVLLRAGRNNGSVELHVLDEGSGFAPGFLPRAFERFSRADPARTGAGAGLGLSIVQVIAEAHGGHAHAANRERGGADVWLSLPAS